MKKIRLIATLVTSILLFFTLGFISNANAQSVNKSIPNQNEQEAIDKALDEVIAKVNKQIEEGQTNISEQEYVPELNDFVGIEFFTDEVTTENQLNRAAPSGIKSYSGKVNGGSFTHTLLGEFTFSGGKVNSASKEVRTSGIAFSHTRPSTLTKLDASLWQVSSTSKHKYLGAIGGVTGVGYTSYITINLYGSGDARLQRATYNTGV